MTLEPKSCLNSKGQLSLAKAQELFIRSFGSDYASPVIEKASGAVVTDVDGKEYLDFSSGQMCATVGHSHPRVVAAVKDCAERLMHTESTSVSPQVVTLGRRLVDLLPAPLKKVLLMSTGSEATEAAVKVVKKATKKFEIVGLADGFHGATWGATSITFISHRRAGYGPALPGTYAIPAPNCYRCPLHLTFPDCDYACARVGFDLVDKQSVGSLAAVIAEPIQGAGGYVVPPPGYFATVRDLCREREMLLILDEAQTGLGRVGDLWGFEQDGAVPDVICISKTLGGGMPLAAIVTSAVLEEKAFSNGFWYYTSHLNEPLPSAVGLAVLDVIQEENLVAAAREKGAYLKAGLLALKDRYEIIGDVRGRGLLMGVDFVQDRITKQPAEADAERITRFCLEQGLCMAAIRQRGRYFVWRVAPPLTISYAEIDRALEIIERAIRAVRA